MNINLAAALYAIPNGILYHFGQRIGPVYNQTTTTKIIENVVQGVALSALLLIALPSPIGAIGAGITVVVKAKNIVMFLSQSN